jgi:glycosyltransferase involved in cell wall biosynthesis
MKVLWLSNCPLIESDIASTGTWIQSMAEGLLRMGSVKLAVIAFANVQSFTRQDYHGVQQWLVSNLEPLDKDGLPSEKLVKEVVSACEHFKPDIVHVWGVESFWGLLITRKLINVPALLEMQGMKKVLAKYITADLSFKELFKCIGIKELLTQKYIISEKRKFVKWGRFEEEIIRGHSFIDVQSEWMSAQINSIHPRVYQNYVDLALRKSFYSARPWSDFETERNKSDYSQHIFYSSSAGQPYKGFHVAIKMLAELKKSYPKTRLRIAGNIQKEGIRQDGYVRWLNRLSRKLNVIDSIDWLGALNADQIIDELQHCSVNVVCSFVESYCLALAEPMYLGVPCVTSFTGGTSWIGEEGSTALFYPPGDFVMCAHQICRVFNRPEISANLSLNAREVAMKRHNIDSIVQKQLLIYRKVMSG